jgi:hypothetical protein
MTNPEVQWLVEHENKDREIPQNCHQDSGFPKSTQQKQLPRANPFLQKDQVTFTDHSNSSKRESWTTFAMDDPFDEEEPAVAFDPRREGYWTQTKALHKFNTTLQQTQMKLNWKFSCDNPFVEQGTQSGNPLNVAATFNHTNPVFAQMRHQFHNTHFNPAQRNTISSKFDALVPSTPSSNPWSKGYGHIKSKYKDHFEDEETPAAITKKRTLDFAGEPLDSQQSSFEDEKSSTRERKEEIKIRKRQKGKFQNSTHKPVKKIENVESDDESFSSICKINPTVHTKKVKIGVKKIRNKIQVPKTDALAELLRGTAMLKFTRRGQSTAHFKFFQLVRSKTTFYLQWFSKRKPLKTTTINIARMNCVLQGKKSNVYLHHREFSLTSTAISIIYKGDRSVDLVAKSLDECKMWYKCLRELIRRARLGQCLTSIQKIWIRGLNYVDRNRPKREQKHIIIRANMLLQRDINARVDKRNLSAVKGFKTRVTKLVKSAKSGNVRNTDDHVNLMLSVTAIQDRLEELQVETRESMDSAHSKHDIWRLNVDLSSLEEKVQVLRKNKNFHLI